MARKKEQSICMKINYKSSVDARTALEKINSYKNENGDRRFLKSFYRCPNCKFFHLSSMTQKKANQIIESNNLRSERINPGIEVVNSRLNFLQRKKR